MGLGNKRIITLGAIQAMKNTTNRMILLITISVFSANCSATGIGPPAGMMSYLLGFLGVLFAIVGVVVYLIRRKNKKILLFIFIFIIVLILYYLYRYLGY